MRSGFSAHQRRRGKWGLWCHTPLLEIRTVWPDVGGGDFYAHLLPESFESQAFRRHVGELSARPHPTQGRSGTEYDALSGHPHQYNQHFGESPSSDVLKDRERAHWRGP